MIPCQRLMGPWPVIIPSLLNLYQHETDRFRSVALTKIIQRYGILDSVVHIDKGSKVSVKNLLYDAETGEALLTRTPAERSATARDPARKPFGHGPSPCDTTCTAC